MMIMMTTKEGITMAFVLFCYDRSETVGIGKSNAIRRRSLVNGKAFSYPLLLRSSFKQQ